MPEARLHAGSRLSQGPEEQKAAAHEAPEPRGDKQEVKREIMALFTGVTGAGVTGAGGVAYTPHGAFAAPPQAPFAQSFSPAPYAPAATGVEYAPSALGGKHQITAPFAPATIPQAPPPQAQLPPGWHALFDYSRGLPYWFNDATKESHWSPPTVSPTVSPTAAPNGAGSATAALPAGWHALRDSGGRPYWFNEATQQSQWQPPLPVA